MLQKLAKKHKLSNIKGILQTNLTTTKTRYDHSRWILCKPTQSRPRPLPPTYRRLTAPRPSRRSTTGSYLVHLRVHEAVSRHERGVSIASLHKTPFTMCRFNKKLSTILEQYYQRGQQNLPTKSGIKVNSNNNCLALHSVAESVQICVFEERMEEA